MAYLLELPAATVEALETTITSDVDPTVFDVWFSFTEKDGTLSFDTGTWIGAATVTASGDYQAVARTPAVGTAGSDVVLTAGVRYGIYCRVDASAETPVIGPQRLGYLRLVAA